MATADLLDANQGNLHKLRYLFWGLLVIGSIRGLGGSVGNIRATTLSEKKKYGNWKTCGYCEVAGRTAQDNSAQSFPFPSWATTVTPNKICTLVDVADEYVDREKEILSILRLEGKHSTACGSQDRAAFTNIVKQVLNHL